MSLEPEELGAIILAELNAHIDQQARIQSSQPFAGVRRYVQDGLSIDELLSPIQQLIGSSPEWPRAHWPHLEMAVVAGLDWLTTMNLVVRYPVRGTRFVPTPRGESLKTPEEIADSRNSSLLPRELLHHSIQRDVLSDFARKQFDKAVFIAFREVEIKLREAVPGDSKRTGKEVVRDALNPNSVKFRKLGEEVPIVSERESSRYSPAQSARSRIPAVIAAAGWIERTPLG